MAPSRAWTALVEAHDAEELKRGLVLVSTRSASKLPQPERLLDRRQAQHALLATFPASA